MKVAIYICGHLRNWNSMIKDSLHFKNYETHVFVSTYFNVEKTEYGNKDKLTKEEIESLFSPLPVKNILVEEDTVTPPSELKTWGQQYVWKMWRKVWQCDEMRKKYEKENNITFDYCVRTRPDVMILQDIEFEKLNLENNIILGFGSTLGFPNDMFAIATPKVMDHYADLNKAFNEDADTHVIVSYTLKEYPIHSFIQIGVFRKEEKEEQGKILKEIKVDDKILYLNFYIKEQFNCFDYKYI